MTEEELGGLMAASPLNKHLEPPEIPPPPSPPLTLGLDHIALLISGGFLDGVIGEYVCKGSARKVPFLKEQTETDSETITVKSEKLQPTIRALSKDGKIYELE